MAGKHSNAEAITSFVIAVMVVPLGILWQAYAIATLWSWFIVPQGVRPVDTVLVAGALLIFRLIDPSKPDKDDGSPIEQTMKIIGRAALYPALDLLVGWIIIAIAV